MKKINSKLTSRLVTYGELLSRLIEASSDNFVKSFEWIEEIDPKTGKYKFKHPPVMRRKFREKSDKIDCMIAKALEKYQKEYGR